MIVVGDVVGKRGKLRFDRGEAIEREILPPAIIGDGARDGMGRIAGVQRAVVLDETFERLPGEIEPVEARIFPLELGDDAQGLGVVVEAALLGDGAIERAFAGMTEWRMAEVVGKGKRLGQIFIDA